MAPITISYSICPGQVRQEPLLVRPRAAKRFAKAFCEWAESPEFHAKKMGVPSIKEREANVRREALVLVKSVAAYDCEQGELKRETERPLEWRIVEGLLYDQVHSPNQVRYQRKDPGNAFPYVGAFLCMAAAVISASTVASVVLGVAAVGLLALAVSKEREASRELAIDVQRAIQTKLLGGKPTS